ncbi:Uma2 family endonuclease [Haloechinothrix sp. LS1_15]|uniref:Uma2 family endonuclease n=1 Tax=Haloechinothrix sp. LS1_15 TaxID=2652248 RepID=UPI0029452C17|nr:Uma2 family endonuclease [Haloechinothrix sp. LS1_15]MDV6011326.1 Uma2 family endonuclease [Haloechinothrix sp. LS1_15]
MTAAHHGIGPWTVRDLLALPEDGNRHELIDGALLMSPPPSPEHQELSFHLHTLLRSAAWSAGAPVRLWEGVGIRLSADGALVPDLVVAVRNPSRATWPLLEPDDVRLLVEIVSPGSSTRDRTEKPYLYAEAGIPHFWRIETADYRGRDKPLPVILRYELVALAEYRIVDTIGAGETLRVDEPIPITFDPAALTTG